MLWTLVAMAVILGLALVIVLFVAYPHRDELASRWSGARRTARRRTGRTGPRRPAGAATTLRRALGAVPAREAVRPGLWLDDRRG